MKKYAAKCLFDNQPDKKQMQCSTYKWEDWTEQRKIFHTTATNKEEVKVNDFCFLDEKI